ncbi:nucleobase:cation symporter-2 family protein [Luteimicrobium subarcticum]|uniref:Xanthine permease n=1 Tax=Luteimicrobium subarcticum TaxID=620910 RepID=A0A2M8WUP2_9MICO|nr:nucleobase:cation symporter-2 family protein [Luteimicrobium subarcticum]PJI94619.1 xanthine permease [Luteimicrobium subarcticum]
MTVRETEPPAEPAAEPAVDPAPTSDAAAPGTSARPEDERLPFVRSLGYGLQHILAMFGGVIAVPLIIGGAAGLTPTQQAVLVSSALLFSGLATLLQTLGVPFLGAQLPLVQGISFASVSTLLTIVTTQGGGETGLRYAYGAVIVAAVVGFVVAPFFSRIVHLFPPVVTGSVITVIGLSLMPTAAGWIIGNDPTAPGYANPGDIALAGFTLLVVLVLSKVPVLSRLSILLGLVVGTVAAFVVGKASTDGLSGVDAVALPHLFDVGAPAFAVGAIVSMVVVMLVIMVETTADLLAVGEIVGTKVDSRRLSDGLRADMLSSAVAPVVGAFPTTAFAQNVGLVALSGIKSRFAVALGGGVLVLLGLSPWLAAVVGVIPGPVLGGAGIVLFGSVTASGVRTLSQVKYRDNLNLVVVATTLGFGLLPVVADGFWSNFPDWFATIFGSGISSAAIMGVALNLFFNVWRPGEPKQPSVVAAGPPLVLPERMPTSEEPSAQT